LAVNKKRVFWNFVWLMTLITTTDVAVDLRVLILGYYVVLVY